MSMDAEAVVLFKKPVPPARAEAVRTRAGIDEIREVDNADLHCWVSDAHQLEYRESARSSALIGEQSLQGRLWHAWLGGRYWTEQLKDYVGNPTKYRRSISAMLAEPDVEAVWYGTSLLQDGSTSVQRVDLATFPA